MLLTSSNKYTVIQNATTVIRYGPGTDKIQYVLIIGCMEQVQEYGASAKMKRCISCYSITYLNIDELIVSFFICLMCSTYVFQTLFHLN